MILEEIKIVLKTHICGCADNIEDFKYTFELMFNSNQSMLMLRCPHCDTSVNIKKCKVLYDVTESKPSKKASKPTKTKIKNPNKNIPDYIKLVPKTENKKSID